MLISKEQFDKIADHEGFKCPKCGSRKLDATIDGLKIKVACQKCKNTIEAQRKLAEETGPELAAHFAGERRRARKSFLDKAIEEGERTEAPR